jgi:hypothetical protein
MPTTIGRNRRQYVINIRDEYTDCRKYNPITGEMDCCNPDDAWELLLAEENKSARLVENDDKSAYTIRFKDDLYELRKPGTRATGE